MQLVIILIVLALAGAAFLYLKKIEKKKKAETDIDEQRLLTAQEFVNAKDITQNCLYTLDDHIFAFARIEGVCLELYSKDELKHICRRCSAELSKIRYPFKYLAVSRPVDVSKTMQYYAELIDTAEGGRRNILKSDIAELAAMAMSGETLERQHYIAVWNAKKETEADVLMKAKELAFAFSEGGIEAKVISKNEIVRLCNLVNNPAYVHIENSDIEPTLAALIGTGV